MIKHGEPNPLNIFGLRQLSHNPPHFQKVVFELQTHEETILNWIYENLEGRFYIGSEDVVVDHDIKLVRRHCVSFESPGEASYFGLCLSQFNCWGYSL
jgi:hypothetical protein